MSLHRKLEHRLATFKGAEAALLFGSGYLANIGIVSALAGRGEVVFSDELNHASIIDGCRLSRAETFVYRHRDTEHLAWGLREAGARARLIVTDGVFSMDGDVAPLGRARRARRAPSLHARGRRGARDRRARARRARSGRRRRPLGRGRRDRRHPRQGARRLRRLRLRLAPAGRAADQHRAAVHLLDRAATAVGRRRARRAGLLESSARGWSSSCAATRATLREALSAQGLETGGSRTQIVPVIVGDARRAMALCERTLEARRLRAGDPPTDGARAGARGCGSR